MRAGLELPRVAWPYRIVSLERIDLGASRGRVRLGEEPDRGHLGEVRVAIVEVPICQSELQRLGHRVDVLGRVVAHPLEVEALEDRERLDQRSEEHTSELQSPCNLVCRLLLEKKKRGDHGLPPIYLAG